MPTVLAGACVSEHIGTCVGQAQRVIQFTVGQQSGIGGNRRAAKLEHQAAVKIEPRSLVFASPVGSAIAAPVGPR